MRFSFKFIDTVYICRCHINIFPKLKQIFFFFYKVEGEKNLLCEMNNKKGGGTCMWWNHGEQEHHKSIYTLICLSLKYRYIPNSDKWGEWREYNHWFNFLIASLFYFELRWKWNLTFSPTKSWQTGIHDMKNPTSKSIEIRFCVWLCI